MKNLVLLTFSSPLAIDTRSYKINSLYLGGKEMIAPWVIEKIKELEREKRRRQEEQPRVYIDDYPYELQKKDDKDQKDSDRGVVIIDIVSDITF